MGKNSKKIDKGDIKKSQIQAILWLCGIGAVALIVIVFAFNTAANRQAETEKQQQAKTAAQRQQQKQSQQAVNNQNNQTPEQVLKEKILEANKQEGAKPGEQVPQLNNLNQQNDISLAEIQTTKGNITVVLQNKRMPITVNNFLKLVNKNFYNGLTFHRVEDWVIQGGDPNGNGSGGSGETISLETNPDLKNIRGALAMARSQDPNSASSQFYILKKDASWLDGQYAVFGSVLMGMDVVDKMEIGDKILSIKVN